MDDEDKTLAYLKLLTHRSFINTDSYLLRAITIVDEQLNSLNEALSDYPKTDRANQRDFDLVRTIDGLMREKSYYQRIWQPGRELFKEITLDDIRLIIDLDAEGKELTHEQEVILKYITEPLFMPEVLLIQHGVMKRILGIKDDDLNVFIREGIKLRDEILGHLEAAIGKAALDNWYASYHKGSENFERIMKDLSVQAADSIFDYMDREGTKRIVTGMEGLSLAEAIHYEHRGFNKHN